MFKYLSSLFLAVSLLCAAQAPAQTATFAHYAGVSGKPLASNGMQQVATYEYYVYVTSTAGPYVEQHNGKYYVKLILPFQLYHKNGAVSGGTDLEPYAYFRWYNYNTDLGDDTKLVRYNWNTSSTNILQALNFAADGGTHAGQPAGWISYNTNTNEKAAKTGPGIGKVGCVYELSGDCDDAEWTGADIACDVSRYCDYNDETNYTPATFTHEPTLSMRYIFHIRPAKRMASAMRDSVVSGKENKAYEDKKILVFGVKDNNGVATLHTELPFPSSYWYYSLNTPGKKHIYLPNGAANEFKITAKDFGTELKHADRIFWRFYSPDMTKYCQFETNENPNGDVRTQYGRWSRFFDLSISKLNNATWWNLDGSRATTKPTISVGQNIYAVYYASEGSTYAPIGRKRIDLRSVWPMTDEQIAANAPSRKIASLEKNYSRSMQPITYDNGLDNTQSAPTSPDDNMAKTPGDFSSRAYGFVYRDLISKSWPGLGSGNQAFDSRWKNPQHSPLHGDYGIYKSANFFTEEGSTVNNVSLDTHLNGNYTNPTTTTSDRNTIWANGQAYMWYYNAAADRKDKQFFDRTHAEDPSRYGGFLYIDASEESRQIASEDFQASLCSGSQLVISAWVASLTAGNSTSDNANVDPQVQFVLYGIDNKQVAHRLCAFTSGEFTSNAEDFHHIGSQGKWYQVFGRVILPAELRVENYSNFRITLYNYCKSTVGADYAIDDIEIFQRTAKLTVIQNSPICPDQSGTKPASVSLKIKGNYETLEAVTPGSTSTLFYKLVKVADGSDVTGENLYGDGYNNYGKVTIPAAYDATAKLADGTTNRFETEADGSISLVLDNRTFSLDPTATYYVSVALPSTDDENTPGAWGNPNASCSTYSPNFVPVQETFAIDGTSGSTTANINVPCGATDVKDYSIKGTVTTTDPQNGGSVQLPNVAMDWYVGSRSEFNAVDGLLQALKNFRQEYSTGDQTQTPKGVYTAENQTLLAANVYSATNTTGKLLLSASTAFTGYPLVKGPHTVCAIPVSTTVSLTSGSTTTNYTLCPDPIELKVNARQQGVNLVLGNPNVVYPASSTIRGIRVGLPQLREIQKQENGSLRLPIHDRLVERQVATGAILRFIASPDATNSGVASVFLSDTNDPTFTNDDKGKLVFANITDLNRDYQLEAGIKTLNIRLEKGIIDRLHEGYWYELQVMYIQTNAKEGSNACPGETFFRLKIVPEYLTWNYNANSNWNNDNNWRRSTAAELYMANGSYTDYDKSSKDGAKVISEVKSRNSYAPMYFTKVMIPQSVVYPYLGYVTYQQADDRATYLSNKKGDNAVSIDGDLDDISYEMEASVPTDGTTGTFDCQNYRGNVCDQIYLKAGAELRSQQFLVYNKAWTELELPVGKWYSVASPLKDTYAGDYYVPAATGRQETQAFEGISWNSDTNNRVRYPFYQRVWGDATVKEQDRGAGYSAWDNPIAMVPADGTLTENANGWSHVFNTADVAYGSSDQNANFAFSMRVGDKYMPTQASGLREKMALVRLPKEDATYSYQTVSSDGSPLLTTATLTRTNSGKLRVNADVSETATGQITVTPAAVSPSDNHYYLIANPYTSSISVSQFLADNANALEDQQHLWVLRGDVLTQMPSENANQVSTEYNVIRPQESFFVKMTTTNQLVFNQGQQVDANIRSNTAKAALAKPMFVTYSYDNGSTTNISKVLSEDDGVLKTWCPSSGQLAIAYGGNDALTSLSVYTLDGRLWQILRPSAQTIYVQIPAGVYLVKAATTKGNVKVKKQVVE